MQKLKGKVAVVTGAGGGMGRIYAHRLAHLGADVAILDVDLNVAKRWNEALTADTVMDEVRALGVRSIGIEADLAQEKPAYDAIEKVVDELGRIDILVNNAGGAITPIERSTASQSPASDSDFLFAVNFKTMLHCCQAAVPHLRQRGGVIVNVASVAIDIDDIDGRYALYAAAKAALVRYSKSLAVEVGQYNIRVNCIAPGGMETARVKALAAKRNYVTSDLAKAVPLRRLGSAEDVAGTLEYLVTDLSAYVTGECIRVSGGAQLVAKT